MYFYKIIGAIYLLIIAVCCASIERVDDSDLIHILTGEGDVVALFTKGNCAECIEYENVVANIQDDIKQSLGASVVQAHDSNLIHIYDPSREPALLYFRRGIPILYYGAINEDEILQFFSDNREPGVKELSDDNFEHLTQASTGATTGDWFVFFYSAECVLCQRLYAIWESVGGKLKRKINVARMNSLGAGVSTAKRLKIEEAPEFIFLRHGKIYRYSSKEYTPKAFIEFAEAGYLKNTHPENVPQPSSLLDELSIGRVFDYLNSYGTLPLAFMGALIVLFLLFIVKYLFKAPAKKTTTKKDK
ncbi:thioredoxin domain-containing protein [Drosophila montana]|uniref:thioredoxin domain-containing protein n=1 Tax=Drosophila montana TaxID=40370 RepID=UPI00313B56D2